MLVEADQVEQMRKAVHQRLNDIYDAAKKNTEQYQVQELSAPSIPRTWQRPRPNTAVDRPTLERMIEGITTFPAEFHVHPKLEGFLKKRREILHGAPMDWATAETLAFGSLVLERTPVRLSGQDSGRGTFSQRHLELYDSENGDRYIPLQHLAPNQARFDVYDSSLERVRRHGIRVRLQRRRSPNAGFVGSAVRRFRQWRADHDRSVHRQRRSQVEPAQRPGAAAAARLRRPGPGAFQRAHWSASCNSAPTTTCRW